MKLFIQSQNTFFKLSFTLTLLSILDAFFTHYGIQHDYIEEANPLMNYLYNRSIFLFFFMKLALPATLLFMTTKIKPKRYIYVLISLALFLYLSVLYLHAIWLFLAFNV